MTKKLNLILIILSSLMIAALSLANMQSVPINLLFTTIKAPLIILIISCFALGFFLDLLISLPKGISNKRQLKNLTKELAEAKKAIETINTEN